MVAELADYDETLQKIEGKGANPEEASGKVTNDDLTMWMMATAEKPLSATSTFGDPKDFEKIPNMNQEELVDYFMTKDDLTKDELTKDDLTKDDLTTERMPSEKYKFAIQRLTILGISF